MHYTFISGATGVIGKCFAEKYASLGDNLFLTGRSLDKLLAVKKQILAVSNINIEIYPCDLASSNDINQMFNHCEKQNFKFSKLINVAGVDNQMAFEKYTYDKIAMQMNVNMLATVLITRHVLALRHDSLQILTISSMCANLSMPYFAIYCGSKNFLNMFFSALKIEMENTNTKITVVMPGSVLTRPDIIKDIEIQGLFAKLSAKSASYVVDKSIKAINKNKDFIVVGGLNKLVYVINKIIPKKLQAKFLKRKWSNKEKSAF